MRSPLRCAASVLLGLSTLLAFGFNAQAQGPAAHFLSDSTAEESLGSTQAWGDLGIDSAARPPGREGAPLRIGEHNYPRGLGHHANGEITVDLDGRFQSFDAEAGIQWQGGNTAASVIFQVFVDGRKVFDSGVVRESDAPRKISIPTRGAAELRLVVTDAGDGITCDCANWALARLTPDPDAKLADLKHSELNIAPFARLRSWDPARKEGTSASRIGEFPAEDIELGKPLVANREGAIEVPAWDGRASIGLQWPESRSLRRLELDFGDASNVPAEGTIVAESWAGESAWQGRWVPLEGTPERNGTRLIWNASGPAWRTSTPKVRWVFPGGAQPVVLKTVGAYSRSRWRVENLQLERLADTVPQAISIEVYNGEAQGEPGSNPHRITWKSESPLNIHLLACTPRKDKTDRTLLRFEPSPDGFGGFGIAVEDVLAHGSVSFRGVRVSLDGGKSGVDARTPAVTPGVLADVRKRPDETVAHTLEVVHREIQNLGPMMLSLACDNRKIVAAREGDVDFDASNDINDKPRDYPNHWRLQVRPGTGNALAVSRRLRGDWLPIPETTSREGGIVYQQATFVAPLGEAQPDRPPWVRDKALGVVELTIRNEGDAPAPSRLTLSLAGSTPAPFRVATTPETGKTVFSTGDRILAIAETSGTEPLKVEGNAVGITLAGSLPPKSEAKCVVYVPLWPVGADEALTPPAGSSWEAETASYWKAVLKPAMQVELPDRFLSDLIRASQVHCLLAARSEDSGRRVAAWISSDRYGPLESEAHAVIRGMDMLGHPDFARRSLDFFIKRYSPEGFLTTGYTLVGTGEHLWTLAEHVARSQGEDWLRQNAPELKRVCRWVIAQRAKTKRLDTDGRKLPGYGLMPPGVSADWNRFAYRYFNDAQYVAGLAEAARALSAIGDLDAAAIAEEARAYRDDVIAAYRWTQARSPVLPLGEGRWTLPQPSLLDSFGHVEEFQPGEDANRSWAYSVELGAHHLAANGILDPSSSEVGEMLEYLEASSFLRSGMGEYPEEESRKDPYGLGGFAKVQPFYARVAEIYAMRDDVKPFLRSYLHAVFAQVSLENMSLWEHFHNIAGWNKTHETGWFLCQSRLILVQERGDELWLAPFVTDQWLEDGKAITVEAAPTRFGKVGYAIRSHLGKSRIEATVTPPSEPVAPQKLVLRLRHPEDKPIRAVTVAGKAHGDFDPKAGTVNLPTGQAELSVVVEY